MSIPANGSYEFGPFRLDAAERQLVRDAQPVALPPKAFDVLVSLVARAGHLVSKEELLNEVWPDTFVEEANLSYTISLVRKALGDAVAPYEYIETVAKRGYRFIAPVNVCEPVGIVLRTSRRRLWIFLGVATAVVVAALAGAGLFYARRPVSHVAPDAYGRQATRLTFDAGLQIYPSWSPEGDRIAYSSARAGNMDIWVQQIAGGRRFSSPMIPRKTGWGRRFDPTRGPVGPFIQVTRLNKVARMITPFTGGPNNAIAVSADKLVVPLFENAGNCNIWMIDNIDR
jgi:DNA-binding winged helix-turn-helix (wHTH) protein